MARPRKKAADKLTRRLPHVRVTEGEFAQISANAKRAGMGDNLSDYVRRAVLDGQVIVYANDDKPQAVQDPAFELIYQLKKIGVNINQQTRKLHEDGQVPDELQHLWTKLDAALDTLLDDTTRSR